MSDWWKYDPATDTWTEAAPLPGLPRQYSSVLSIGDTIYLTGGVTQSGIALDELWAYSVHADTWTQKKPFPAGGRQSPVFFSFNNSIVCGMGRNGTNYFNDLWIFYPNTNAWIRQSDFPYGKRWEANGFSLNGYWGIGSGRNLSTAFNDWYWYDPIAGKWQEDPSYQNEAVYYSAAASSSSSIVLYGGLDSNNSFINEVLRFSSNEKIWTMHSTFPSTPRKGAGLFVFEKAIYLVCGMDPSNNRLNECWKSGFNNEADNYQLFPNPATNWITLTSGTRFQGNELFEIFSIEGKKVIERPLQDQSQVTIDIPALQKGYYFCRLRRNSEILFSSKIIVAGQ